MEIRSNAILFPSTRNTGPILGTATLTFPRNVQRAVAVLTGYSATFENHADHHLGSIDIQLDTTIDPTDGRVVRIDGYFGLRDWSGTFDDAYSGTAEFALLADLVPATGGGPGGSRDDLVVTDAEITQAIQHFRGATFLNSANVFPDNSIRLVADKATAIRLWTDYDGASPLPGIAMLWGTIDIVDAAGTPTTIGAMNTIVPGREIQLSRANPGDTLNFLIPENLCRGSVSITARVFDLFDVTQTSAAFQRTLNFESLPALRLFAVGINYTGPDTVAGKPTSAPVPTDFATLFTTTELLYPIPAATQTGYMTMDYDKKIKSDIAKGCDLFDDLREDVKDLRGDSTDVFYGLLNTGVDTGSVAGCGAGGGVCVGVIGKGAVAAHELGHVFGRQHAPCDNVTRCNRPLNTDDDYPEYSGFDSDSIGEFGFNPNTGLVFNPGTAHDMMGYSGTAWISPYTYKALMTRIPVDDGGIAGVAGQGSASAAQSGATGGGGAIEITERIPMLRPYLFTRFSIRRDRKVTWRAAFHFDAGGQATDGRSTTFVVEQRDKNGDVLLSECLHESASSCGCSGHDCLWPKKFSQAIPFDPQAKRLVILECDTVILDEAIPDPPKVYLTCKSADDPEVEHISCSWGTAEPSARPLWYLLQWRDRAGVWRGVAPRTQRTEWSIPKSLWGRGAKASVRVLATSGIATGMASCTVTLVRPGRKTPGPRQVDIHLVGVESAAAGSIALPAVVRAVVTNADGMIVPNADIRWHGRTGGLIGRGRSLPLHVLPVGVHLLRAAVANSGDGDGTQSWIVERTRDGRYFWHRGTITYPDYDGPPRSVSASIDDTRQGRAPLPEN